MRQLDDVVRLAVVRGGLGAATSWFLITSWLYYCNETSVISDALFDELCVMLLNGYEEIEHPHFRLLNPEALAAGSGYYLAPWDYPRIVRTCAERAKKATEDFSVHAVLLQELTK